MRGQAGLALNEAFVALQQERLGVGVFRLARQTRPKKAHDMEPIFTIGPVSLRLAQNLAQKCFGFGVSFLTKSDRTQWRDDAGADQRVAVRVAAHGLHRQFAQGLGVRQATLFEVFPPQVGQMQSDEWVVLDRQLPTESKGVLDERLGFDVVLLHEINPRQNKDAADGSVVCLAEDTSGKIEAVEGEWFGLVY